MMNGGSSANPAPNLGSAFSGSYAGYVNRNSTGALYYGSHVTFQSLIVHQLHASNKGLPRLYSDKNLGSRETLYFLAR
ncbi:MAG: hypothetical protein CM15mP8_0930 [Methanobacteriota archaeon]|nr:MAG: hypothetical protein CM15mP8_0930 [Euryarchaeota archaeon]